MAGVFLLAGTRILERWHAEVMALEGAGDMSEGAELYVTLEPCNHRGKTPPCTEAIVDAGIRKVYVAMRDSNPEVCGGGVERLKNSGVEVEVGLCQEQARSLNCAWLHSLKSSLPYLLLKLALSKNDALSYPRGDSRQWISSNASRALVSRLRAGVDAIMVGSGTLIRDNPRLTNRTARGRKPLRVVLDSELRGSLKSNIFLSSVQDSSGQTVVFCRKSAASKKIDSLIRAGIEVHICEASESGMGVSLIEVLTVLSSRGVSSILCEGGGVLAEAILREGFCQQLLLFRSGKEIGAASGVSFFPPKESWASKYPGVAICELSSRSVGSDIMEVYQIGVG